MVPPRILRRIIKLHAQVPGLGLQVPHRKAYVLAREALFRCAERTELGLDHFPDSAERFFLISRPNPERLAALSRPEALHRYWRLLYHLRIHAEIQAQGGALELEPIVGRAALDEIRAVLVEERFLLPPGNDAQVGEEFAALYLELRAFAPELILTYFPGLGDGSAVNAFLDRQLNAMDLLQATRLPGAPDPGNLPAKAAEEKLATASIPSVSPAAASGLSQRAARARQHGNDVRAAILDVRAQGQAPADGEAAADLRRLVQRLQQTLALSEGEAAAWQAALAELLVPAATGFWPAEARLLYDLQKVCLDRERAVFTVDLLGSLASLGRRPVKRQLIHGPVVLQVKHLRAAERRLPRLRLSDDGRAKLTTLLRQALHAAEARLRSEMRPHFEQVLAEVGLQPQNVPERVARAKLLEELLDEVANRGFLSMSLLRDAISRNSLKLPDLQGPRELAAGDPLLRANRRLKTALDGVYHGGEVYLRGLQRFSALASGTGLGRWLTKFLVLPYGGAFVTLEGLQHLVHPLARHLADIDVELAHWPNVLLLGTLVLGLLHWPAFRRAMAKLAGGLARVLRGLAIDLPAAFLRLPWVQQLLASRPFRWLKNFVLKPAAATGVVAAVLPLYEVPAKVGWPICGGLYVVAACFLNSRWGHGFQEIFLDAMVRVWLRLRIELIPQILRFVLDLFRGMVELVERGIYTVDEWLRFRSGESRLTLAAKAGLGAFWSVATYLIRIYINLLIEPTFNPIKHFPVVTVAAKIILPFSIVLAKYIAAPFLPLGPVLANAIALINITLLPGVYGFLVWEFKENWKLYAANRPHHLRPVPIGHHGETLRRLLRPGFHSGTIPKLFARLRRAERKALAQPQGGRTLKYREDLLHVQERIGHFIERELLALLALSRGWAGQPVRLGGIRLSSNRILIPLSAAASTGTDLTVSFAEHAGWIVAGLENPGWLSTLRPEQQAVFAAALAGLYHLAAADLVKEELAAALGATPGKILISEDELVLQPAHGSAPAQRFRLSRGPFAQDRPQTWPLWSARGLPWITWVDIWQDDAAGKEPNPQRFVSPPLPGMRAPIAAAGEQKENSFSE